MCVGRYSRINYYYVFCCVVIVERKRDRQTDRRCGHARIVETAAQLIARVDIYFDDFSLYTYVFVCVKLAWGGSCALSVIDARCLMRRTATAYRRTSFPYVLYLNCPSPSLRNHQVLINNSEPRAVTWTVVNAVRFIIAFN